MEDLTAAPALHDLTLKHRQARWVRLCAATRAAAEGGGAGNPSAGGEAAAPPVVLQEEPAVVAAGVGSGAGDV